MLKRNIEMTPSCISAYEFRLI